MPMHRASRLRRFAVALLVVLLIAVAVRFARANTVRSTHDPGGPSRSASI